MMVLVLEIVEYFLILVFVKPKSNMDRHQYYIFQISFVHSRKVLAKLQCCGTFFTWVQKMSQTKATIFRSVCDIRPR